MARYIDAYELIAQIEGNTADTWGKGLGRTWWSHSVMLKDNIVNLIRNAPTADVAKEFTCFVGDPHKVEHCPYLDEIEKAKAEVSREIFEEIGQIKKEYASGDIDGNELYVRLYLLEKKYTEGK